jgi:hypothetical protein
LGDPGVDEGYHNGFSRSGMEVGGAWTGLSWLRTGTGGGLYKCGNEPWGSIKCGDFLD